MTSVGEIAFSFMNYLRNNHDQHKKNGMICFIKAKQEAYP